MKKQITRIAPHQSAKVIAILYVIASLPFALIGIIGMIFGSSSQTNFPFVFFMLAPVIYGVIGYLFFALFCWLYNIVANQVGGIEFSVKELPDD